MSTKLLKRARKALQDLAGEAMDSVEYSDWPELQEKVDKAFEVAEEIQRVLDKVR